MQLAQEGITLIKGKRSKRPRPPSSLELTMATSSSTATDDSSEGDGDTSIGGFDRSTSVNLSLSNNTGEFTQGRDEEEEADMAKCLILLAKGRNQKPPQAAAVYQCKTCNKSFHSFQALGGHRASHSKPIKPLGHDEKKAPLREKQENYYSSNCDHESTILSLQIVPRRISSGPQMKTTRVHECSICGAEFASGQALGGHMRRHRPIPAAENGGHGGADQEAKRPRNMLSLDLNLPAPEDTNHNDQRENKFPFAQKEQVIVFSASPLVDCHY